MPRVPTRVVPPEQGSVSLPTTKTTAIPVIPESGLVAVDFRMTLIRAETIKQDREEIMATNTSRQWAIFWFSSNQ